MKLKFIGAIVGVGIASVAFAAPATVTGVRQNVWPDGKMPDAQDHQRGAKGNYVSPVAAEAKAPWLEWYEAPAASNRVGACMILVSGGSYQCCCDIGLLKKWQTEFTKRGFQCVALWYRTPRPKGLSVYRTAWEDGQRAVRLVRADAAKRGYDPEKIGVIGMSAGGHLVCMLATSALTPSYAKIDAIDDIPCHVNWAIPNAPAYNTATASDGTARPQDGTTLTDLKVNPCFAFDAKTCPMCFHHGANDPYTPNGSTLCYRELRKRKIPAELHLYSDKGHGAFGFERALEFINQMNFVGTLRPEVDLMSRYPHDADRGAYGKEPVWPAGLMPDVRTNQCTPYIEWHCPKKLATKAIQIVYSGGSYSGNDPNGFEVAPMRRYLNAKGVTVVTMKYRTPRPAGLPKHVTAWQDLQRAIRIVRSQANARGLDPNRIGIMGSSAGGHLTLMGALSSTRRAYPRIDALDDIPCNVQWAIAIYPAYALTDGAERGNVHGGNLPGDDPVPEFAFDALSAPICFIHGDADGWAAMNSVRCWEKLRSMGVQCDLHTLATRPHCFQRKAAPGTGSYTWMDRGWEFLTSKGFVR